MATLIYFDQFALIDKLKASGITAEQSEAIVRSIATAQDGLVSKEYMKEYMDHKFTQELAPIRAEQLLQRWMLAATFAAVMAILFKLIFSH